jgi:uncharacterized membrane protein
MSLKRFLRHAFRDRSALQGLRRPPRRRAAARTRLGVEGLEERVLLDGGLGALAPPALVVGRTLSSYTTEGVQNNQETLTYTVYNEQAAPLSGVLLTDALQPGVTFQSASALPDRSGPNLAWSLGPIGGFGRASVTLTVSLGNPLPLQLDTGAHAFGTLNAGTVSNATPAAMLRPGSVAPTLLASTPDANTTDPFVQEEAAKLNYDPQQIFNFLHNDVGYNSYLGSVRGARGALWSSAGNALDVASLGVALMRASGIPAQYVSGTLSQGQAQPLILSMFPASFQTAGYVPAGTPTADPAHDPQLLSETEAHYWFQFDAGSGMRDADPLMAGAQVGQAFTAATGTFTEVPDNLREKTEVKLTAEIYSQANAVFGPSGLSNSVVLDQTFNDVDLVGRPLSIGNFVNTSTAGLILSSTTNTYSPYLDMGDEADPTHDTLLQGTPYQEVLTNFPLGSQILTGLFLDITLTGPGGPPANYERALLDRIGYAVRQQGGSAAVALSPSDGPAIADFDLYTVNVLPGLQSPAAAQRVLDRFVQEQALFSADMAQSLTSSTTVSTAHTSLITAEQFQLLQFAVRSQNEARNLAVGNAVAAYFDRPSVTIAGIRFDRATGGLDFSFDLRRETMRVVAAPGQNPQAAVAFNFTKGLIDNVFEQDVIPAASGTTLLGTINIVQQALAQGVPFVTITSGNLPALSTLDVSAEAKARITAAVLQGAIVATPVHSVMVGTTQAISWLELNPSTGEISGVLEDGTRSALGEEATVDGAGDATATEGLATQAAEVRSLGDRFLDLLNRYFANPSTRAEKQSLIFDARLLLLDFANSGIVGGQFLANLRIIESNLTTLFQNGDPPVTNFLLSLDIPFPDVSPNPATGSLQVATNTPPGLVAGAGPASSLALSGRLAASWSSGTTSSFLVSSLNVNGAMVVDAQGHTVGSGVVALAATGTIPVAISGSVNYAVNGQGSLSFYGPAESSLGVSGNWDNYSATVTGNASLTLTTDGLMLNGQALPAGMYTITTSAATLAGNGPSTSPNFSGSASITATGGTLNLGPGSGSVTVGGSPLDVTNSATLTGYTGTITVAAGGGNNADTVTLNGTAANVLTVAGSPATLTADQNTPATFHANVHTSFADTYTLTAQAPPGWTVTVDANGNVTATPAPGLQSGTYPIQLIAQSTTNPDLVAQSTVHVMVTPTQPGVTLSVQHDPLFTVPVNGAQVPTAFQVAIHNNGPTAVTENLAFSNLPSGFTLLNSGTSVTIPAGQTGIVGGYLVPTGSQVPAQGTPVSFTVTATNASNPADVHTANGSFTIPAIDGITLASNPIQVNAQPGIPGTATLTVTNVGNLTETVTLSSSSSAGLTVNGLQTVTLAPGQSATETISLTPSAQTPFNSILAATITATFGPAGAPVTQTLPIPVDVVVPGAQAIAGAAVSAGQVGEANLATQLTNLAADLTNLVQNTGNAVFKSQVLADLDAVTAVLPTDPFLAPFTAGVAAARGELARAVTASDFTTAFNDLANVLTAVAAVLGDEAAHGFTVRLSPNSALALPSTPTNLGLVLQNNGSQATTYDLGVSGLPGNVTAVFTQNGQPIQRVTLQPGQALSGVLSGVILQLTETGGSLFPTGFTVTVTPEGAPELAQSVPGTLTVRPTFITVSQVDANPATVTTPGTPVDVTAHLLNSVNQQQQARASYTVTDPGGRVVFTSTPVPLTITVQSILATVDLGSFPTTGLARGNYTINVTLTDLSGNPIPGATGQGTVLIGTPVTASLSTTPWILPAGNGTVATTLQVNVLQPQNPSASTLYITSTSLPGIQKVDLSTNTVTNVLRTPPVGPFSNIDSLIFDNSGDLVYSLYSSGQVGLYNPNTNANTVIASSLNGPADLFLEAGGQSVLLSEYLGNRITRINLTTGAVSTLATNISGPNGIAYDNNGNLFVVAKGVDSLLQLNPTTGAVLQSIPLHSHGFPDGMTFDPVTGAFWVTDDGGGLIEVSNYLASPRVQESNSPLTSGRYDGVESDGLGNLYLVGLFHGLDEYHIATNTFTALTSGDFDDVAPLIGPGAPTHSITATVTVPTNNGVSIVPNSFNIAPTTISSGAGFETLQWDLGLLAGNSSATIIWQSAISGLQSGEARPVALGARVQFSLENAVTSQVNLDPEVNANLQSYTNGGLYPSGGTTLNVGGVSFTLAHYPGGGTGVLQTGAGSPTSPFSIDIPVSFSNPRTVYTLINSAWGRYGYLDGSVEFFGTNGAYAKFDLVQGTNVRDHNNDGFNNTIADGTPSVGFGGGQVRFDRQTFVLPSSFTGATLTDVRLNGYGNFPLGQPFLAAVTVASGTAGTTGTLTLPPTVVTGAQILGLSPAAQTVAPAATATYTVTVSNPTSSPDTFNLSVLGVPAGWVSLPASVTVPANSTVNVSLTLTSAALAVLGDYGFTVTAADQAGAAASVHGDLILAGQAPVVDVEAQGVVAALTPAQASAGQGTSATYTVQLTNTGSAVDTFSLAVAGLPPGITATFAQTTVPVPPGTSNFRDVTLTLTPQPGTPAGGYAFTVTATSTTRASVTSSAGGTLTVLANGVRVALSPPSGAPDGTFQLTVTNTGQVTDTYNLALAGPAALVASLGTAQVTLAPGASQVVPITTGAVTFADPGALPLTALATSQANPAVRAGATASLNIATTQGLTAQFNPAAQALPQPGTASFLLLVNNAGNAEDAYTATITGTSGPVTASLVGLDGRPTQTIALFRLPGLSAGALLLQTSIAALGQGTVTVQVRSLSSPGITATATATVTVKAVSLLLLDPTGRGALTVSGQGQVSVSGAAVLDSGSPEAAEVSGQGRVSAQEIDISGSPGTHLSGQGTLQGAVKSGQPPTADPLASLRPPAPPPQVYTGARYSGGQVTLQPGTYRGGISVSGQAVVTLQPGIYYLQGGGLSVSGHARVTGDSVLIYNAPAGPGDGIHIDGQASVSLTAASGGPYAGIAIFQDRTSGAAITIASDTASLSLSGSLYAAGAPLTVSGHGSLSVGGMQGLPLVIAADLTVTGGANVTLTAAGGDGPLAQPPGPAGSGQTAGLRCRKDHDRGRAAGRVLAGAGPAARTSALPAAREEDAVWLQPLDWARVRVGGLGLAEGLSRPGEGEGGEEPAVRTRDRVFAGHLGQPRPERPPALLALGAAAVLRKAAPRGITDDAWDSSGNTPASW